MNFATSSNFSTIRPKWPDSLSLVTEQASRRRLNADPKCQKLKGHERG